MISAIAAPVAALALLAGHAAPQPFSLTLSPAKSAVAIGQTSSVRVYDTGTTPLALAVSERTVNRIHGQCTFSTRPVLYVALSKTAFRVRPGKEVTVRVHVRPGARPGPHTLATIVSAPTSQQGNVRVAGAAASLMLLTVPGHVAVNQPKPCVHLAAPAAHAGISFAALLASVAGFLVVLIGGLALLRRRHNRMPRMMS